MNTRQSVAKRTFSSRDSSRKAPFRSSSSSDSKPRSFDRASSYQPSEASSYGSRSYRPSNAPSGASTFAPKPRYSSPKPSYGGSSSYSSAPRGGSSYSSGSSYAPRGGSSYGGGSSYSSSPRPSYGSSRPSYGGSSSYGSSRPSYGGSSRGSHGGYARGGSSFGRGGRGGGGRGQYIDINKFINKVKPTDVKTDVVYVPKHTFNDFNIAEEIKTRIAAKGFVTPSPIQDQSIPYILEGKDVVGIANTGTGKTAAFLIPLVDKVMRNPKEQVLIMAPTRELAIQIEDELLVFIRNTKIYSVCCVGGAPIRKQISELRYFNNFIIGTPGRLKDLGEQKYIKFEEFTNVVLDEADRMLDMGFIDDMRYMIGKMPKDRQTLFFTATMSKEIERLVHEFLNNPVNVSVKTGDTAKSVDQDVVRVGRGESKMDKLHELLSQDEFSKVLIFGQTKSGVERLTEDLMKLGHKAGSIHGDKNHVQRQRTLRTFKENNINILVATDVAARGLDIAGVTHVINYELPMTYDDYVHRIGRTGRGGATGKALTFVAH